MIPYERTRQPTIPHSAVKIIGVGGAGANMLDRIALDGMEGAELLACNTDARTLTSSVAPEKIQLGRNLTKGLGAGGDPELGKQAAHEAELELRDALRDRRIIFICVGLGGGTGSGAAPLVARLAREEGAVVVVFATTPFTFEGKRRRQQAETALNELSVLANALITFDNTRMGELVLAQQGVHEAFGAADRMISESIRAVTRIVMRPGLVNIGLDDVMAALSSPQSRCLFGSGIAEGENRAQKALKNALGSPLLDRGSLLQDTQTVLVHVCGGEDLTLYELELLMRGLSKHVPETAQILFGASVDPAMGGALSVTLVSSLPEERLHASLASEREGEPPNLAELDEQIDDAMRVAGEAGVEPPEEEEAPAEPAAEQEAPAPEEAVAEPAPQAAAPPEPEAAAEPEPEPEPEEPEPRAEEFGAQPEEPEPQVEEPAEAMAESEPEPVPEPEPEPEPVQPVTVPAARTPVAKPKVKVRKMRPLHEEAARSRPSGEAGAPDDDEPVKLPSLSESPIPDVTTRVKLPSKRPDSGPLEDVFESAKGTELDRGAKDATPQGKSAAPSQADPIPALTEVNHVEDTESEDVVEFETIEPSESPSRGEVVSLEEIQAAARARRPQGELALDGGPKGKFEGEDPNLLEGEDLDIPPFLRRKK